MEYDANMQRLIKRLKKVIEEILMSSTMKENVPDFDIDGLLCVVAILPVELPKSPDLLNRMSHDRSATGEEDSYRHKSDIQFKFNDADKEFLRRLGIKL